MSFSGHFLVYKTASSNLIYVPEFLTWDVTLPSTLTAVTLEWFKCLTAGRPMIVWKSYDAEHR